MVDRRALAVKMARATADAARAFAKGVRHEARPYHPLLAALAVMLLLGLVHRGYWHAATETDPTSVWNAHYEDLDADKGNLSINFTQTPGDVITFKGRLEKSPRLSTYRLDNMLLPGNASAPGQGYHFVSDEGLALTAALANRTLLWVDELPVLVNGNLTGWFYEGDTVTVRATLVSNITANVLWNATTKVNLTAEGWVCDPEDVVLTSHVDAWFHGVELLVLAGGITVNVRRTPGLGRQLRGALRLARFEMWQGVRSVRLLILAPFFIIFISAMGYVFGGFEDADSASIFYFSGANDALVKLCFFTFMIVSLAAVSSTFDTIQRERLSHTLELLLARPLNREAIVLGKALGITAAVGLPALLAQVAGLGLMGYSGGNWPSPLAALGYLVFGQMMIFTFVTIQLCFAILARSGATAAVSGLGLWLVFALLWTLLIYMVAFALGVDIGAEGFENDIQYQTVISQMGLLNPGFVFQFAVGELMPRTYNSSLEGVDAWMVFTALVAWPALSLWCAAWLFRQEARG